jgi:hypothetical protein
MSIEPTTPDETAGPDTAHVQGTADVDPFDLDAQKVHGAEAYVQDMLVTVSARKPDRSQFFRVRSGPEWTIDLFLFTRKMEGRAGETYMIAPTIRDELPVSVREEVKLHRLFVCVDKRGVPFIWPARLPNPLMPSAYHTSALDIAKVAEEKWVRMYSDTAAGYYKMHVAEGDYGEPAWTQFKLGELVKLAYKERLIDSLDHDVIKELVGRL